MKYAIRLVTTDLFNARRVKLSRLTEIWNKHVTYICEKDSGKGEVKVVFIVSSSAFSEVHVGSRLLCKHDQTGKNLDYHTVVNIVTVNKDIETTIENEHHLTASAPVYVFK